MKNRLSIYKIIFMILAVIGTGRIAAFPSQLADSSVTILKNVNVLDFKSKKFRKGINVAILDGKIISLNPDKKQLRSAKSIDLSGKYLIPGLIDTHVHVTAHWKNNMNTTFAHLDYYLRHGITSVRDASGDGSALLEAQRAIKSGERSGSSLYFAAFMAGDWYYNRDKKIRKEPYSPWEQLVTEKTDLDSAMREAKACGATGVKLYHSFDQDLLKKVVTAAKRKGLKTWGHAMMYPATPNQVAASGVEVLSHVFMLENLLSDTLFFKRKTSNVYKEKVISEFDVTPFCKIMKKHRSILDATLSASEDRDPWIFTMLKKVHAQGVEISAGTDQIVDLKRAHPRLLDEISAFVNKCGFSNIDAIKAATVTAAKVIGQEKNIGSVEKGKIADLLVLNGNPLIDILELGNIKLIMQSGKIVHTY